MDSRENFGRFGALMAMAGSAVGLGNLWRFPYLLGENGGGAFLIVYIAVAFLLALPIFFAEFIIGRRSSTNCFGAFRKLAPGTKWQWLGLLSILVPLIIVSYYSVVGGWTIQYLLRACCFDFSPDVSQEQLSSVFSDFVSSVWPPLLGFVVFLGTSALIVLRGVKKGIERFGKIAMPVLFFIVIAMAVYVLTIDGAFQGLKYLFTPDFSKITPHVVSAALGQSFFSMSLGCGCIMTYASYVRKKDDMVAHCAGTSVLDLTFAVIAGCAIMPAVFAFGVNPSAGPSLVYETLPFIFSRMALGNVVAIVFFVALLVAALTSEISMFEAVTAYLTEEKKLSRARAVGIVFTVGLVLGGLCSLSFGPLSDFKVAGKILFDFLDSFCSDYLMTLGALMIVIFVGWKMKKEDVFDEFTSGGIYPLSVRIFKPVYFTIRYIAPVVILTIMISGLLYK